jgi:nitrogen fixation/metabolism regulation signal transduction histidine kinase
MKPVLRWIVIIGVLAGLLLTYQISRSMTSAKGFEANYTTLLAGVAVIGGTLLSVTIYQLGVLIKRVSAREFGSRLALKITIALGLMALVPGVLLYLVSSRFIESSVDTFYNERIEQALESGIKLGQAAIQVSGGDLASRATAAAQQIADWRAANQFNLDRLEQLRKTASVDTLVLTNATGFPTSTHGDVQLGGRAINTDDTLQLALISPQISNEQLNEKTIVVRAVVAIPIVVTAPPKPSNCRDNGPARDQTLARLPRCCPPSIRNPWS